jgi:RNA polymerase sigma factor (sigma-70 family)
MLRYFARRTLDPDTAADLTAETFAEAFSARARFRDEGVDGAPWLDAIARHQLGRFFRSGAVDSRARRRLGMPERDLSAEDHERIEELIDFEPLRRPLARALEELSGEQREAMRLRVMEGRPYPEVAAMLECTEATARARVSRGLRKLAKVLASEQPDLMTEAD